MSPPPEHPATYVHATAIVVGEAGVLVRGPSGAGKSRLALRLLAEARHRRVFGRLVGDDRVSLAASAGRLVARGHPAIAGQIERRGAGILHVAHEAACVVRIVIDLRVEDVPRWPCDGDDRVVIDGVDLPRLVLRAGLAEQDVGDVLERLRAAVRP